MLDLTLNTICKDYIVGSYSRLVAGGSKRWVYGGKVVVTTARQSDLYHNPFLVQLARILGEG